MQFKSVLRELSDQAAAYSLALHTLEVNWSLVDEHMLTTWMNPVREIEWDMKQVNNVMASLMEQFEAWMQKAHEKEEAKSVAGFNE